MKQPIDLALAGGHVVTMSVPDFAVYPNGVVLISGDQIVDVGSTSLLEAYNPAETIDCSETVIIPGLINAHTHVPMGLMRGLADDLRLDREHVSGAYQLDGVLGDLLPGGAGAD